MLLAGSHVQLTDVRELTLWSRTNVGTTPVVAAIAHLFAYDPDVAIRQDSKRPLLAEGVDMGTALREMMTIEAFHECVQHLCATII